LIFENREFTKDLQQALNKVEQASGAYKLVHVLTSGPSLMEVIKPEHEILKECLQKIARTHDQMVEYAIGKIQDLQRITMEIINEEEMIDIVDRYIRSNEDTGPAKYEPVSDKQSEDER
jgi:hypothetical protein